MNQLQKFGATVRRQVLILALIFAAAVPMTAYLSADRRVEPATITTTAQEPPIFGDIWARTELYFGTSMPNGKVVTDKAFKIFLDTEITPRFPDGLTQLSGFGQFKNSTGMIVQENSKVVILLYPLTDLDASNRIEAIRVAYKQAFQQESVLRVDSRAGVSF